MSWWWCCCTETCVCSYCTTGNCAFRIQVTLPTGFGALGGCTNCGGLDGQTYVLKFWQQDSDCEWCRNAPDLVTCDSGFYPAGGVDCLWGIRAALSGDQLTIFLGTIPTVGSQYLWRVSLNGGTFPFNCKSALSSPVSVPNIAGAAACNFSVVGAATAVAV